MACNSFTPTSGSELYKTEYFAIQNFVINPKRTIRHIRHQANQRERKRMRLINSAFAGLCAHLPVEWIVNEQTGPGSKLFPDSTFTWPNSDFANVTYGQKKRLSKVEILRLAIHYIQFLYELLAEQGSPMPRPGGNISLNSSKLDSTFVHRGKLAENLII
ncbi:hypothetical protein FBUS_06481 [Fasciolopsis buskii]|uniref:BHLH domain-containing protein n=1 Tax=Fasciolopsis buskii TaxID=27845 RepID=A0A8E0VKE5_9TREM|nr:hypothetical protein FBUS_06481 [Fasciolopsis buski]